MDTAGDEEVARALGGGLGEDGGFDFEEALAGEAFAHGEGDLVAEPEVALHLGTAQVDVAVLEADFLVLDGFFSGREGGEAGVVEHAQLGGLDLDFAGVHLGVDGVFVAQADFADGGDDILGADLLALGVALGDELLVEHDLGDAGAVAEVEEDEVAVVAAAIDPAHEDNLLACVSGAQIAAEVGAF